MSDAWPTTEEIEADDGERCWIVHDDQMHALEAVFLNGDSK